MGKSTTRRNQSRQKELDIINAEIFADNKKLEKENEQLKSENESLKSADNLWIDCYQKDLDKLRQQLKEKDEEIAEMKELDKATCESLYASRELFEKEKVKRWKLEKQLKSNTKQVCEKIRENFKKKGMCEIKVDGTMIFKIEMDVLNTILYQIEKGEKDD